MTLWWIGNILLIVVIIPVVVVILVVIALLTLLSRIVDDIDVAVDNLWTVTKRLAQNSTGMYQFAGAGSSLRSLRDVIYRQEKIYLRDRWTKYG